MPRILLSSSFYYNKELTKYRVIEEERRGVYSEFDYYVEKLDGKDKMGVERWIPMLSVHQEWIISLYEEIRRLKNLVSHLPQEG